VAIDSVYETSLDLSYRSDSTYVGGNFDNFKGYFSPVWTPAGDRIFYTNRFNIYSVSANGGKPRLEFESIVVIPHNGKNCVEGELLTLTGISPDGETIYFTRILVESVKFTETGFSVDSWVNVLQSLDLRTGTVSTIARDAYCGALSKNGKYINYYNKTKNTAMIHDLTTGEEWALSGVSWNPAVFVDNDQNILYTQSDTAGVMHFFKVPVKGGDPVQVVSPAEITGNVQYLDVSPDGKSAIFTIDTLEKYSNSYSTSNGTTSYTKTVLRLYLCNLGTGAVADIVPYSKSADADCPAFSPDGTKIVYDREDMDNSDDQSALFIKDVSSAAESIGQETSVAEAAPMGFALTGNYPNPFNPSTHIAFALPSDGQVRLSVYSVTGQKVRDLVTGRLTAGSHEMVWDGRDEAGTTVSSGIYIARLQMGNFTAARRMTLMK
jgi:Tol biopolymer transport system component